jgi:uncharacterized protein DUF3850
MHKLKTWPSHFGAVMDGSKTFEVRPADRDFAVGNFLILQEWDPEPRPSEPRGMHAGDIKYTASGYTGREATVVVTHILPYRMFAHPSEFDLGQPQCVMSIRLVDPPIAGVSIRLVDPPHAAPAPEQKKITLRDVAESIACIRVDLAAWQREYQVRASAYDAMTFVTTPKPGDSPQRLMARRVLKALFDTKGAFVQGTIRDALSGFNATLAALAPFSLELAPGE